MRTGLQGEKPKKAISQLERVPQASEVHDVGSMQKATQPQIKSNTRYIIESGFCQDNEPYPYAWK